jgi:hypothetical protein
MIVLVLAASACARMVVSRSGRARALGIGLAVAWTAAAVVQTGRDGRLTGQQVSAETFQIRTWSAQLPRGASVRVDIAPSGWQLWAAYMLSAHPVDAPDPVLSTTYAHPRYGRRADYAISLRYYPNPDPHVTRPVPPILYARNPPVFENSQFVLRRVAWPRRLDYVRDTSSLAMVEP